MIKKIVLLQLILYVSLTGISQTKSYPEHNINWKSVKVLVYTRNGKGYVHENIAAATASIKQMAKQYGFSVDVSDTPIVFTDASLKKYNLLIFNNTNNEVFDTDEQKVALMRYVQAGGGFAGLHSVTGTERQWPWFKRLVGGTFVKHARHQPFKEIIIDPTHPSVSFLPKIWERDDECYFVKEVNPDLHVLVVHDLSSVDEKEKPEFYGNTFPSVWCHEFDGGRQWYTSLGHDSTTYATKEFQKHIMGGIKWVIGNNKALNYGKAHAKKPDDPLPY